MIAYKGFSKDLKSIMGNGKPETCSFQPGSTMTEESSKTGQSGYHCCDHPFGCLDYYGWNGQNRFFKVEASGDINEDGKGRIACTQITLLKELSLPEMAMEEMIYMIEHPDREGWECNHHMARVVKDEGICTDGGAMIVRGERPRAKGPAGSFIGFLIDEDTYIRKASVAIIPDNLANKWLELVNGKPREVGNHETEVG